MDWDNSFLSWFATQSIPMSERVSTLGKLSYYQFSTSFDGLAGHRSAAFGCSVDRKNAAIKCAAETVERKVMHQFFDSSTQEVAASSVMLLSHAAEWCDTIMAPIPPRGMRTSNGWAVHSEATGAATAAFLEALERHLLIKSYHNWGWAGFRLIQESRNDEMHTYFMISRLTMAGYVAGIVAAKSPLYPGISLGYCVGLQSEMDGAAFWQPALLESISKIHSLAGRPVELETGPNQWLSSGIKFYLETPFDIELLRQGITESTEEEAKRKGFIKIFDLTQELRLDFPLFAAFCWGGNFIPLCDSTVIVGEAKNYFHSALAKNNLTVTARASERHPII